MQNPPEALEDGQQARRRHLVQQLADLLGEVDGDLDAVVRRLVQEHRQELQRDELVGDLVVHEVAQKLGEGRRHDLVAPLVRAPEADDDAL